MTTKQQLQDENRYLRDQIKSLKALQEENSQLRVGIKDLSSSNTRLACDLDAVRGRERTEATRASNAEQRAKNLELEAQALREQLATERSNVQLAFGQIRDLNAKREGDARLLAALYLTVQAAMERKA